jgi:TonB family protein
VAAPVPQPQRELGLGRVTATALNVREEPTTDAPALTMVRRGDTLHVLEEKEGWYRVRLASGQTGWVSAQYVTLGTAAAAPAGRRRAGGCPPDSDYAFEKAPLPSFSENGGHGLVVVEANVNAQGSVTSTKVVSNTTGDAALAAIAEREIRGAKFIAPVRNCVKRTFIFTYKRAF